MYLTSKFGDLPPIPDANVHNLYFAAAPGASDLPNYDLYIDGRTGDKVTLHQFRQTVRDVATALVAPASDGGLSVSGDARDVVGIFSHNCIVSSRKFCASVVLSRCAGLPCAVPCIACRHDAVRTFLGVCHSLRAGACYSHGQAPIPICPAVVALNSDCSGQGSRTTNREHLHLEWTKP